jgi:Iron-containing redox enzyme
VNIQKLFDEKVDLIGEALLRYPWDNESAYANWLAQTYHFVRHTTTMIAMSAARFGVHDRPGHYQMIHHLREESGHDLLLVKDLENLGWKIEQFPPLAETRLFYQNQYYMINHETPVSHAGYALMLEGLAAVVAPNIYPKLAKLYGQDTCEFLHTHLTVDQEHYGDGTKELAHLSPSQVESVLRNLEESSLLYTMILERAARAADQTGFAKTA